MDRFFRNVNQKVNLGRHPRPACPDIAILKDWFFNHPSKYIDFHLQQFFLALQGFLLSILGKTFSRCYFEMLSAENFTQSAKR